MNKDNNINTEKLEKLFNIFINDVGDEYFENLTKIYKILQKTLLDKKYVENLTEEKLDSLIIDSKELLGYFDCFNYSDLENYVSGNCYINENKKDPFSPIIKAKTIFFEKFINFLKIIKKDYNGKRRIYSFVYYGTKGEYGETMFNERRVEDLINLFLPNLDLYDDISKELNKIDFRLFLKFIDNNKFNFSFLKELPSGIIMFHFCKWYSEIKKIRINNYFTIKEVQLENIVENKEIYFLGENGAGKTILLQNILLQLKGNEYFTTKKTTEVSEVIDIIKNQKINYKKKNYSDVLAYGVSRNNLSRGLKESFEFMTLFSNEYKLRNPIEWLIKIYNQENEEKVNPEKAKPHIKLEDAKEMLSDLLNKNVEIEVDTVGIEFKEKGNSIDFNSLADGYKSILIWVTDMISRFSETQPYVTKLQDFKGTVLIDELDLFLHPKLAYKIMKKLKTWFQRVRFIISTHSPVLILGASEDAIIYKVYKNEKGETQVSEPYEFKDYLHLTSNAFLTAPFMFDLPFSGTREMINKDFYKDKLDTGGHFNIYKIYQAVEKRVKEIREEKNIQITEKDIENWVNQAIAKLEEGNK